MRSVNPTIMILTGRYPAVVAGLSIFTQALSAVLIRPQAEPVPVRVMREDCHPRRYG
ncbi:hypothetical protein [Nioella aestuarii]|uniref:hypothetical protein n=1 Tax=Nioella aestuarii TaxID=1662864 RepID=UPI003D7F790E